MAGQTLKSMTGYGESTFEVDGHRFTVRCRTVNHKSLDIRCKLPLELHAFERSIQKVLKERLFRGHVDLVIQFDRSGGQRAGQVVWNEDVADRYRLLWRKACGNPDAVVDPAWLLLQDSVWSMEMTALDPSVLQESAIQGVESALNEVKKTREEEGDAIVRVLLGRLVLIDAMIGQVKVLVPEVIKKRQLALRERIEEASGTSETSSRLEEELVHLADKMDVDEEVSRLESHVKQFRRTLEAPRGPVGKRLAFLVQEMLREATTIASKSGVETVSNLSVDARVEIERIREQIMNVE